MSKARIIADYAGTGATSDLATQAELDASYVPQGEPHIIPGVLYPSYVASGTSNKLLDGTTSHSGAFGTAQSDGRKYYYTNIAGSKPIKDPRIGGHFGSQRHKTKTLQLLEQETATEGKNIYSIDGREWMRAYSTGGGIASRNWSSGHLLEWSTDCTGCYIEIVGYFNDINFLVATDSNRVDDIDITVNGTLSVDGSTTLGGDASVASPLYLRYVDAVSVINGGSTLSASLGTTPAINTLKYEAKTGSSEYIAIGGIELIAQDTTSTATKSQIQIPSQNVVSYGKKFTVSGTPHYDPFNGFTNDTTLFSSVVDVATSLGLGTATTWGAPWDKGSDDHIRPFNGGRVVKWVDSSGNIKTSVTMMPANAQNIGTSASNEILTASATNSQTINFSDDAVEHSLSEIAKTYLWQEFGNGSANGAARATYGDATMLASGASSDDYDNISYVMDDGLTSLSGYLTYDSGVPEDLFPATTDSWLVVNFIGTGISFYDEVDEVWEPLAQNLPYGTHIMSFQRHSSVESSPIYIDGVQIKTEWFRFKEFAFHQPKKPPIPEEAVVLADYMLMADFVVQGAGGVIYLSKGTRYVSASRDFHYAGTGTFALTSNPDSLNYRTLHIDIASQSNNNISISAFGTRCLASGYNMAADNPQWQVNDSNVTGVTGNGSTMGSSTVTPAQTLGNNKFAMTGTTSGNMNFDGFFVDSPIHTSSHYQTFETPFLHELVGGDRNMEQTNLVVTPDGKTWDEVSRDTSYIGNMLVHSSTDTAYTSDQTHILDEWRGNVTRGDNFNKDFAIAYDRLICLVDGQYAITHQDYDDSGNVYRASINYNGTVASRSFGTTSSGHSKLLINLKRGDYIMAAGHSATIGAMSVKHFFIERV